MSFYGDVLKKETDSMDRKEKDFAPWSFKLNAEPKKGLKLSHTHKEGGSGVNVSKIELPEGTVPGVEGIKGSYEFDKSKFTKTGSMDVYKQDGVTSNLAVKWAWTPKDFKHVINATKKVSTNDLGGFHAFIQSECDFTKVNKEGTTDKIEHKHSVNMKGKDWQFGMAFEQLDKMKKVGMKCTYAVCDSSLVWAKADSDFPQAKHNSIAAGASWKNAGWEHLGQVTFNMPNKTETATKEYAGLFGMPVDLHVGHNYKVSADTELQCSYKCNADVEAHHAVSHKINDNMTAKMHQHYFSKNNNAVDVGFELTYKL